MPVRLQLPGTAGVPASEDRGHGHLSQHQVDQRRMAVRGWLPKTQGCGTQRGCPRAGRRLTQPQLAVWLLERSTSASLLRQDSGTDWATSCPRPPSRLGRTTGSEAVSYTQQAGPDTQSQAPPGPTLQSPGAAGLCPIQGSPTLSGGSGPAPSSVQDGAVPTPHRLALRMEPPPSSRVSGLKGQTSLWCQGHPNPPSQPGRRAPGCADPEVRALRKAGGVAEGSCPTQDRQVL